MVARASVVAVDSPNTGFAEATGDLPEADFVGVRWWKEDFPTVIATLSFRRLGKTYAEMDAASGFFPKRVAQ